MAYQIVVAYQCAAQRGEIIGVYSGDHEFTGNETLSAWVAQDPETNGRHNWHRRFTIVRGSDKSKAELEYLCTPHLIEGPDGLEPSPTGLGKHYFVVPDTTDPAFLPLNQTGEIECPSWEFVQMYLRER